MPRQGSPTIVPCSRRPPSRIASLLTNVRSSLRRRSKHVTPQPTAKEIPADRKNNERIVATETSGTLERDSTHMRHGRAAIKWTNTLKSRDDFAPQAHQLPCAASHYDEPRRSPPSRPKPDLSPSGRRQHRELGVDSMYESTSRKRTDRHCAMRAQNVKQLSESFFLRGKTCLHFCADAFSRMYAGARQTTRGTAKNQPRRAGAAPGQRCTRPHWLVKSRVFLVRRHVIAAESRRRDSGHLKSASGVTYD